MALRALPNPEDDSQSEPQQGIRTCPVCDGRMELVYDRHHQQVMVCVDCQSGVTVPGSAWEIARIKRETRWMPKP